MSNREDDKIILGVKEVIAEVAGCKVDEITLESEFYKDLGIDSIKAISIAVLIERKFGVSIRDSQVEKIVNVKHTVDLLKKILKKSKKRKK